MRPGSSTGAPPSRALKDSRNLFVVGRGLGLGVAQEAALKLKETSGLHAEAIQRPKCSTARWRSCSAASRSVMLAQDDETRAGNAALAAQLVERGAALIVAGIAVQGALELPTIGAHPAIAADAHDPELLPPGRSARARARARSRPSAASRQSHRDAVMATALVNGRVLTDGGFVTGQAVLIEGDRIAAVVREQDDRAARAAAWTSTAASCCRASSTCRSMAAAACSSTTHATWTRSPRSAAAHRRFGTTGFLPTLISDDLEVVARGDARRRRGDRGGRAGRARHPHRRPVPQRGAQGRARRHASSASSTKARVGLLTSLRGGRTLVTLAPEMTTPAMHPQARRRRASSSRAGHTDATYEEITRSAGRRRHRLHAPVQRHVAAHEPPRPARWARRSRTRTAGAASSSTATTWTPSCCASRCAASGTTDSCW